MTSSLNQAAWPNVGGLLRQRGLRGPLALVTDENVARHHAESVLSSLHDVGYTAILVTMPAGETHKTMNTVQRFWDAFLAAGLERGSTAVALGGGVVGDLTGFAAATYFARYSLGSPAHNYAGDGRCQHRGQNRG